MKTISIYKFLRTGLAAFAIMLIHLLFSADVFAVTGVNPSGVNVNHTGVNTVFLTFQNLGANEKAVEAFWCGEVIATGASAFNPCVPGTVLGTLPALNNFSRNSGTGGISNLTDIMTIPASVTRRALQQAQAGANATFFYVRHFNDGITDTFITVTCRMAGGGARSPLALTNVAIQFETEDGLRPVYFLSREEATPPIRAKIEYNGTGRLKGRWEVVLPGDPEPLPIDLLTEATLPAEQRANQRRYTLLSHFDVFLPPTGEIILPGPSPKQIPTNVDGPYKILLRVEATAEKEGNSNTLSGTVISGGVAGFPIPVLRYYIGSADTFKSIQQDQETGSLNLFLPAREASLIVDNGLMFSWQPIKDSPLYELEVQAEGETVLTAITKSSSTQYNAPPWMSEHTNKDLKWRVKALAIGGDVLATSEWRALTLQNP